MNISRRIFMNMNLLTALGFFVVISGCHRETDGNTGAAGASPREESPTAWHEVTVVDELWKVGRLDGPEYEVLGRIRDVTFVGAGLALSDGHSNRIHWYDSSGQHEMSAGGSGGGPGEFAMIHSLDLLPDGYLAALNLGGSMEFFSDDGDSKESIRFPGASEEMCLIGSTLVVLGILYGSELPLHLIDLADGAWTSIGTTGAPPGDSPHRRSLVSGYAAGMIGCMADRIIYARSSDGTVRALNRDGSVLWEVKIPFFVARVYEDHGERGIGLYTPEGATEIHGFAGVTRFGQTIAVQILCRHLRTEEFSLSTVFLDLTSGQILGKDDSLPLIMAAREDRIAVVREEPVPEIVVYSITHR